MTLGCQRVVAETMKDLMESEGDRIDSERGDSFYCDGVGGNDDYRWTQFCTVTRPSRWNVIAQKCCPEECLHLALVVSASVLHPAWQ